MNWSRHLSWVLHLGAIALLFGLVWAICIPNFVHSGPSTMSGIVGNLRQIQGAKEYWAFKNHETNDVIVTRAMLDGIFERGGYDRFVKPVARERYTINTLWKPAEAELTKEVDGRYPRGTLVRLGTNTQEEIILPNKRMEPADLLLGVGSNGDPEEQKSRRDSTVAPNDTAQASEQINR